MKGRLRFVKTGRGRVGLVILGAVLGVALLGPLIAPYDPAALVGIPGEPPGNGFLLGTDYLGHDVLSRVLWGGRSVLWQSVSATLIAFVFGTTVGLIAGYGGSLLDPILMRSVDVVMVFPPLLFFLIVATAFGTSPEILIAGVAIVEIPGVARIVHSATREASVRGYVEAAVARGESTRAILRREIIPSILPSILANFGLVLTYSILLVAAVNFLGLGLTPPAANWGLMVSENRPVLSLNAWATIAPAGMIAALTIGVNVIGDAISHVLGRSGAVPTSIAAVSDIRPVTDTSMPSQDGP